MAKHPTKQALELQNSVERMRRKANQEWEMAGLASQDGDSAAAMKHTAAAKEWDRKVQEAS